MKKILLVSDNHSDEKVIDKILENETYDISVHLGDSLQPEEEIKKRFDIYVSGNNECFSTFEESRIIEGLKFVFIHGHTAQIFDNFEERPGLAFAKSKNADVLVFGHTHTPFNKEIEGIRLINPGSTSLPRNGSHKSYVLIIVDKKKIINVQFKNL